MARLQWKSRRNAGIAVGLIVLYLTIRIKYYQHEASVFLPNVTPHEVWNYVADFSNMKYLNPTIVNFSIIDESGNYDHWKYSVEYLEYLSHWPNWANTAVAHFNVKTNKEKDAYLIYSTHKTCMLLGLFCLHSDSEFTCKVGRDKMEKGAFCDEKISYQCPVFLSWFCRREVIFQRTAIMNNLKKRMHNIHNYH